MLSFNILSFANTLFYLRSSSVIVLWFCITTLHSTSCLIKFSICLSFSRIDFFISCLRFCCSSSKFWIYWLQSLIYSSYFFFSLKISSNLFFQNSYLVSVTNLLESLLSLTSVLVLLYNCVASMMFWSSALSKGKSSSSSRISIFFWMFVFRNSLLGELTTCFEKVTFLLNLWSKLLNFLKSCVSSLWVNFGSFINFWARVLFFLNECWELALFFITNSNC